MPILSWDQPPQLRARAAHNELHQSDSGIDGTYVPNMSRADQERWKAKKRGGQDPRVEIRKTVGGTQVLLIVRLKTVRMSMNGPSVFTDPDWFDMMNVVIEARDVLLREY